MSFIPTKCVQKCVFRNKADRINEKDSRVRKKWVGFVALTFNNLVISARSPKVSERLFSRLFSGDHSFSVYYTGLMSVLWCRISSLLNFVCFSPKYITVGIFC